MVPVARRDLVLFDARRGTYPLPMPEPAFDPTTPLAPAPEPWASTSQPSLRDGPPYHMDALEETEALKQDRLQAILGHLSPAQVDRVAAALDDIKTAVVTEFGPDYLAGHDHAAHRTSQEGTIN